MKKLISIIIVLILAMNFLIGLFHEEEPTGEYYTEDLFDCEEVDVKDSLNGVVSHRRSWEEFGWDLSYCTDYSIGDQEAYHAEQYRNNLQLRYFPDDGSVWRELYYNLYLGARDRLTLVQDSLKRAGDANQVDREGFARMVVAFVQDIPYQYVVSDGCEDRVGACDPHVNWGIYSPVEFMYHLKGDCDTRTVLLYTLLKNFGYDPVIINSVEYGHSMLALDIPSSGDDFLYKGRKYAYWETTNVGWLPGMLPPEMNNKDYWYVALDYEYKNQPTRIN